MDNKNIRVRAAGILVDNNKILLIKHKKNNNEYWLLPGGGVDYGETFSEAVKREFFEETNLNVKVKDMVFIMESINPDGGRHIVNVVFIVEKESGDLKIADEAILDELKFIDIEELSNYTVYPNMKQEIIELVKENKTGIKYIENRWENG